MWVEYTFTQEVAIVIFVTDNGGGNMLSDALTLDEYQTDQSRTSMFRWGDYSLPEMQHCLDWNVHGLTGEAGEVADIVKKVHMHGHAFDRDKFIKELGDILWYVSECARLIGCPLSEIAERNIKKLEKRYPSGFSQEASKNRKEVEDGSG